MERHLVRLHFRIRYMDSTLSYEHPMGEYTCPIYCSIEHIHFIDHEGLEQDNLIVQNELLFCQDTPKIQIQLSP